MRQWLSSVAAAVVVVGVSLGAQSKPSLQGVWRVVESVTTGPTAFANKSPQPGYVIFAGKHYAIVRDTARQPRPAIKDAANPTAAEALATWRDFMSQAGTYEAKGASVVLTPSVAKNPPADGKYGNATTYSMKLDGNNLTLISESTSARGKIPNPTTVRLVRVE